MKFNKRNLILFILIIISIVIWFLYNKSLINKNAYRNEVFGIVEDLRFVGRGEGYIQVKFKNEDEFDNLTILYLGSVNQKSIQVGDSINKPINSNDYKIFRKHDNKYEYYKTLKREP